MSVDERSLGEQLGRAVGCHQRGDLEGASRLYRAVLAVAPGQFDALHYLGLLEAQRGNAREALQWLKRATSVQPTSDAAQLNLANVQLELGLLDEALVSVQRAVQSNPRAPVAFNSQGVILLELGRAAQALPAFERALALEPGYADALSNRGNALLELKRADEALASYERALKLQPQAEQVWNNRGDALLELKRYEEAVASYDRALQLRPDYAQALHHRGMAHWERQAWEMALTDIERALQLQPEYAAALNSRGNVLLKLARADEALTSFERALQLQPDYVDALSNRGEALLKLQREDEALASCERALQLAPAHAAALNNIGNVWLRHGDAHKALGYYERALTVKPDYAVALNNVGNALMAMNRVEDALAAYQRALDVDPNYAEANLNISIARLLVGDYANGWPRYEWRWQNQPLISFRRHFNQPQWRGEPLQGKTILLHAEQGLGDTLQFCRYTEMVAARGASVVLEVQPPLKPLLASLQGVATLCALGETLPPFDCHCPLLSLPLTFGTALAEVPAAVPYLQADAASIDRWRKKLGEKTQPRIGLVWSGNLAPGRQHDRTLPLAELLTIATVQAQFFSLQKEVGASDRLELERRQIRHCGDELADFGDTAALVELMDLVITIDTSVAHLAGALGKPVWILLRFNPDWRWMLERADNAWYPSARLFRQSAAGDWSDAVESVKQQLPTFLQVAGAPH